MVAHHECLSLRSDQPGRSSLKNHCAGQEAIGSSWPYYYEHSCYYEPFGECILRESASWRLFRPWPGRLPTGLWSMFRSFQGSEGLGLGLGGLPRVGRSAGQKSCPAIHNKNYCYCHCSQLLLLCSSSSYYCYHSYCCSSSYCLTIYLHTCLLTFFLFLLTY